MLCNKICIAPLTFSLKEVRGIFYVFSLVGKECSPRWNEETFLSYKIRYSITSCHRLHFTSTAISVNAETHKKGAIRVSRPSHQLVEWQSALSAKPSSSLRMQDWLWLPKTSEAAGRSIIPMSLPIWLSAKRATPQVMMAHALSCKRIGVNKKNSNLPEQQFIKTEKEVFRAIQEKQQGWILCRLKELCCFGSITPRNAHRQSRWGIWKWHNFLTGTPNCYASFLRNGAVAGFIPLISA